MATSLQVFRAHMRVLPDGTIDASRIHSPECYADWLEGRGKVDSDAESRKFQRSLSNHLSGVDGRSPFEPEEELAILRIVRRKECWPCFPPRLKIGSMGFRSKGFHEKRLKLNVQPLSPTLQAAFPPPAAPAAAAAAPAGLSLSDFAQHILGYSTAFERFGIDVSMSIYGLLRSFFETKVPPEHRGKSKNEFADSAAYAELLCSSLSSKHGPEWAVTVYGSSSEFAKRIVAQNAQSKQWYGDFVSMHDNSNAKEQPRLIQAEDWGKLTFNLGSAYASPGTDFFTKLTCKFQDGSLHLMDFKIYCDPVSFLYVGISRPVQLPLC